MRLVLCLVCVLGCDDAEGAWSPTPPSAAKSDVAAGAVAPALPPKTAAASTVAAPRAAASECPCAAPKVCRIVRTLGTETRGECVLPETDACVAGLLGKGVCPWGKRCCHKAMTMCAAGGNPAPVCAGEGRSCNGSADCGD